MHIWKTSLHRLRLDWQPVFTTHLAYSVLGFVIFAPLLGLLGRLLLKLSDKPAVPTNNLIRSHYSEMGPRNVEISKKGKWKNRV